MKRLAAVAVMLVWFSCGTFAQRGGSRSGFSGAHAGVSHPSAGFSRPSAPAFHSGLSRPSAPAFHSGFSAAGSRFARPAPTRFGGPVRVTPRPPSYPIRGQRPAGGLRMPNGSSAHRAPYHNPYGWNHSHDRRHYYPRNHVVFVSGVWPPWGWGYPYIWQPIFSDSDDYDQQQTSNYAAPQPADNSYTPYQAQPEDQAEPAPRENSGQQPNTSRAPYAGAQSLPPASEAPVTLVFKDGRPPEQIHNYLLTPKMLTVLDQRHRDIPVDQIDLDATSKANLQAGVEFSIPSGSR